MKMLEGEEEKSQISSFCMSLLCTHNEKCLLTILSFPVKKINVKCIVNSKCLKSITILFEHVSGKHIYTQNHTHFVVVWVTIDLHCMN